MIWRRAALVAAIPVCVVGLLHLWRETPRSPPHAYITQRPLVAVVGGRAEQCVPPAWGDLKPERVVNLARRDTDWRSVVDQVQFALSTAPPGVLVAAIDPEQLLHQRLTTPDPDRLRRDRYALGGVPARVYGAFDRYLSVPRLFEKRGFPRVDAATWGAQMGTHWADPDGLRAVRSALDHARSSGVEVQVVVLPLPEAAAAAWRAGERGNELGRILDSLGQSELPMMKDASFPDGITCSRVTGRSLLER